MGPCREHADGDRPAGRRANAASRQGQSQKRGPALEGGRPARVARRDTPRWSAGRREPLRKEARCRKAAIQDEALVGAPSPSGYPKGEKREDRLPRAAKNRGDDACPNSGGREYSPLIPAKAGIQKPCNSCQRAGSPLPRGRAGWEAATLTLAAPHH